jgi:peptide-N4-(N-acetyl-beta-glucosaminyl)asparagine amidase
MKLVEKKLYNIRNVNKHLCMRKYFNLFLGNPDLQTIQELDGEEEITVTADLSGGTGENAWQHTQLFRQSNTDLDFCPFEVKVYFS